MIYTVTDRLIIDDEVGFAADIARAVRVIECHLSVACGSFEEAGEILSGLGFTPSSVAGLLSKAIATGDVPASELEVPHGLPR